MIGIYKIENIINKKVYIGQSWKIQKRFKEHKSLLNKNCNKLYNAIKKYRY